jgi:hypothetical protein
MIAKVGANTALEWLGASRAYGRRIRGLATRLTRRLRSKDIDLHPGSWVNLDQLDSNKPYLRTFRYQGEWIDDFHQSLAAAPGGRCGVWCSIDIGIDGYLQWNDALKIYELARFTKGDVLELGTHYGLSASIIANALEARGSGTLETVDIDAWTTAEAAKSVRARPGGDRVTFTVKHATRRLEQLAAEGRRYGFIFIDHWHGYDLTVEAAQHLAKLLEPGGFVQFHDFVDPGNADPDHFYGVFQAALDTVCKDRRFLFCGNYGCTAVFRFL